jgi:enamine deaminase RidA (YjgF/YER057c/UK114 family)
MDIEFDPHAPAGRLSRQEKMQDLGRIEAAADSGNRRSAQACAVAANRPRIRAEHRSTSVAEDKMAGTVEKKLASLGVSLPTPASPIANYVPFVRSGNMLVVSGQICFGADGKVVAKGQLGGGVSIEDGQKAARACAVNLLAQLKAALGDLDKVVRVVRLGGFINSAPGFADGPKVMNGASDLMVEAFGDKGRHARSTVGVSALPADAAVEVEGLFEVS